MQTFDQAVNVPILTTSGNNQLVQSSETPFNVNDAEFLLSSHEILLIRDQLPSLNDPAQIPEVNA